MKIAETDVALQSSLRAASLVDKDAREAGLSMLREQLTAKDAVLSELAARSRKLADKLSRAKTHSGNGGTVLDGLESAADDCERPLKRAKVARSCEDSSTTPSTAAPWHRWLNKKNTKIFVKR